MYDYIKMKRLAKTTKCSLILHTRARTHTGCPILNNALRFLESYSR